MTLRYNDMQILIDCINCKRNAIETRSIPYDEDLLYALDIIEFELVNVTPETKVIKLERTTEQQLLEMRRKEVVALSSYLDKVGLNLFSFILETPVTKITKPVNLMDSNNEFIRAVPLLSSPIFNDNGTEYSFSLFYSSKKKFVLAKSTFEKIGEHNLKLNKIVSDNYNLVDNTDIFTNINSKDLTNKLSKYLKQKAKMIKSNKINRLERELESDENYYIPKAN